MKREFSSVGIRKLYIPDFCTSSRSSGPGVFFASVFSTGLTNAKDFTVLNRVDAHRFLVQNRWTDCDLSNPEILGKFAEEFRVDAILVGTFVPSTAGFSIELGLHDLTGKELFHSSYSEPYRPETIGLFPASPPLPAGHSSFPTATALPIPKR